MPALSESSGMVACRERRSIFGERERAQGGKNNEVAIPQPINRRTHASLTIANNEASLVMDDFAINTPSVITLASAMKMRAYEMFWRRVDVQLICLQESSAEQIGSYSAVLSVCRRRHQGCLGNPGLAISLDRRMHPVRMLTSKPKDVRKLKIGLEYGWRSKRVWFRAPNCAIYEQWTSVIQAALQVYGGTRGEDSSLSKFIECSGVSATMTTTEMPTSITTAATTTNTTAYTTMDTKSSSACSLERLSSDSYPRGCSNSFQSEIPDEEWTSELSGGESDDSIACAKNAKHSCDYHMRAGTSPRIDRIACRLPTQA